MEDRPTHDEMFGKKDIFVAAQLLHCIPKIVDAFEGDIPGEPEKDAARLRSRLGEIAPALVIFLLGIAAWELVVVGFGIQEFLLPRPSVIVRALSSELGPIAVASRATFTEAIGGFLIEGKNAQTRERVLASNARVT